LNLTEPTTGGGRKEIRGPSDYFDRGGLGLGLKGLRGR